MPINTLTFKLTGIFSFFYYNTSGYKKSKQSMALYVPKFTFETCVILFAMKTAPMPKRNAAGEFYVL